MCALLWHHSFVCQWCAFTSLEMVMAPNFTQKCQSLTKWNHLRQYDVCFFWIEFLKQIYITEVVCKTTWNHKSILNLDLFIIITCNSVLQLMVGYVLHRHKDWCYRAFPVHEYFELDIHFDLNFNIVHTTHIPWHQISIVPLSFSYE